MPRSILARPRAFPASSALALALAVALLAASMLVVAIAPPAAGQEASGDDDPAAAFDAAYAEFSAAYRAADPDRVAALYTEDAYYLSPDREIARGDVPSHFAWLADGEPGEGPIIEFDIVDRDVSGDLAYDIGTYTMRRDDASETPAGRGKFIVIWKRGADGTWKIHADGYSGIAPPEAEDGGS